MKTTSVKINNIGEIKKTDKILQANMTITTIVKVLDEKMKKVLGDKIKDEQSMIAVSEDSGKTCCIIRKNWR